MEGLNENKAWRRPRADAHFRLKESQPFRGMVQFGMVQPSVSLHAVEV